MTTKFSKAKLAEIQEKKAKGGLTGGLLTRKCQRNTETPKDDPMVASPIAKSVPQCLASPTSSLELIASTDGGSKAKGKNKAPQSKKDKDHLKTLEKSIDTKKAFSKLRDKKIDETLLKVDKASSKAVEKFKASDEYSDKLYDYYVEGFDLFCQYLAKHHPELDFSQLDMEEVEKEILANRPTKATAENDVVTDVAENVPTNPSSSSLP
nr:hypothetical protein CFP56_33350 [Quercus suber]